MVKTLEELIENRKALLEAHRKNNFTDGIHSLLTDLYPDNAHFIYELLQNSEDMMATTVRFRLSSNGIYFEHNGTKRAFNLQDIDSITNIGHNSQKKNDPTAIGKFGVGFKAVFAYTSTPEIHSGRYHFKIKEYFLPVIDGVEKINTIDAQGIEWTKFYFPFDNPKKPKEQAVKEIEKGLNELNEDSILFLRYINRIEYTTLDGATSIVSNNESTGNLLTLSLERRGAKHSSTWLRFQKQINVKDDRGDLKEINVSLAYGVDTKQSKPRIIPVHGKTYIYFPAEKEHSGLRFNINAGFASTVARDSIRDCKENSEIFKNLCALVRESLQFIRSNGYLTVGFLSVLPNDEDHLGYNYSMIRNTIYGEFIASAMFPARKGGFVKASKAIQGPNDITELFDDSFLKYIKGVDSRWIVQPQEIQGRYFLKHFGIKIFSQSNFFQLFYIKNDLGCTIEDFIINKSDDWYVRFYRLCLKYYNEITGKKLSWWDDDYVDFSRVKTGKIFPSEDGEVYSSTAIFLPLKNKTKMFRALRYSLYSLLNSDDEKKTILKFLKDEFALSSYEGKAEAEDKLKYLKGKINNGVKTEFLMNEYLELMLYFADYSENNNDIDFSKESIWISYHEADKTNYWCNCDNFTIDSAYGYKDGDVLIRCGFYNRIWSGYKEKYTDEEFHVFKKFTESCGLKKKLEIIECNVKRHPAFSEKLNSVGKVTEYEYGKDYNLNHYDVFIKNKNRELSILLWKLLREKGKDSDKEYETAIYKPNSTALTKKYDSSLIYYLKKTPWIPDAKGKFFKPEDILETEMDSQFKIPQGNYLIDALEIGSAKTEYAKNIKKSVETLEREGYVVLQPEELKEYEEFKKFKEKKKKKDNTAKSYEPFTDIIKGEGKEQIGEGDEVDDDYIDINGQVQNSEKRTRNILSTFESTKNVKPAIRKHFAEIYSSSNEEKNTLYGWYKGECQICGTVIRKHNGGNHFVARNIISTRNLPSSLKGTMDICWNSLCLCPNCSAKYLYSSKDISSIYNQILDTEVIDKSTERIDLAISLEGITQYIRFVPKHFLALKTAFEMICKNEEENNEDNSEYDNDYIFSNNTNSHKGLYGNSGDAIVDKLDNNLEDSMNQQYDTTAEKGCLSGKGGEKTVKSKLNSVHFKWLPAMSEVCPRDKAVLDKTTKVLVYTSKGGKTHLPMYICPDCKVKFIKEGGFINHFNVHDYCLVED